MSDYFVTGLVSVLIPTYNRKELLRQAIASCLSQTYDKIEVIVVDDGSTDGTEAAVKEILSPGMCVIRYVQQYRQGPSAARNRGLLESQGEFIQYLDSDDILQSDKLELDVYELNREAEIGVVYSRTAYVDSALNPTGMESGTPLTNETACLAFAKNCWHTISPLYRRQTCYKIGPWAEELRGPEDLEYAARIKILEGGIKFCDRVSALARATTSDKLSHQGDSRTFTQSQETFVDRIWKLAVEQQCLSQQATADLQAWMRNAAIKYALLGDQQGFERCLAKARQLGGRKIRFTTGLSLLVSKILSCRKTGLIIRWLNRQKRKFVGN